MMNILLGVYACEPNKGSEPEVGWQMANEIAKIMPNDMIYAITKTNNQQVIEAESIPTNLHFFYYEPPKWLTFWKRGGRGVRTYYYLWMIGASLYMKKQNIRFDILHHVTFVNDWLPSFLFLLKTKDNKFIWGPIGSHDPINFKFLPDLKRKIIEIIRISLQLIFRNLDPSFHISKAKADCIIGINENVKDKLSLANNKFFISEPAIGMPHSKISTIETATKMDTNFTIISVGRFLYIKNFSLTIRAFAQFLQNNPSSNNATLQIIGDGGDRVHLESLVNDLNIKNNVIFTGKISLDEVQAQFTKANLFLFPTLENAGFVILEAMSHALPVLAMNYGGPQQFIKHFQDLQLVSATNAYDEIVSALAKNIERLYHDDELCKAIGKQNHVDMIESFTWEAKAQKMIEIYRRVLDEKA